MVWILLTLVAVASPDEESLEALRERLVRAASVDQNEDFRSSPLDDVRGWLREPDAWNPARGHFAESHGLEARRLAEWRAAEKQASIADWHAPGWLARGSTEIAGGSHSPAHSNGDLYNGSLGFRTYSRLTVVWGVLEGHLGTRSRLEFEPDQSSFSLDRIRVGVRTRGFRVGFSQEPRWIGPARQGSLLWSDGARPLPGGEIAASFRLPGKADFLGRFSVLWGMGWLPETDRAVDGPGWLLMNLRWQPVPWVEFGLARTALYGGKSNGVTRSINFGQLLIPTQPHVENDPDRLVHDSDERAAWDIRITPPFARWWGGPIDYVELYIQHGGEDVIAKNLGPIPYPTLTGSANVYGAEVGVGPWVSGLEVARIEDDLYRWYTGHRLYHTGWTIDGESLGHPRGGDMRSLWLHSGYIGSRVSVDLSWEHVRRVQVADLLNDQVFVLLNPETRDVLSLRASWWAAPIGNLGLQVAGGPVQHHNFVPNANRFESHFSITWSSQGTGPGLFGRR